MAVEGVGAFRLASGRTVTVGRAPDCDLVVDEARVSWHHASFWVGGDQLWVSDLGSSNGTQVDGAPVRQATALQVGQAVRLGGRVKVRFSEVDATPPTYLLARDDGRGRLALRAALRFGHGDVDVPFAHDFEVSARLLGVLVVDRQEEEEVRVGESFQRGGVAFTVLRAEGTRRRTALGTDQGLAFAVRAGTAPPFAELVEPSGVVVLRIEAETRALLAYVLGTRIGSETAGAPPGGGWVEDLDVARGLWGRQLGEDVGNRLKVLVHRFRAELKSAGVPGELLQRKKGWMRLRAIRAELDPV